MSIRATEARGSSEAWPLADRIGLRLAWAAGILLCAVVAAIVLYVLVRGLAELRPSLLFERPLDTPDQSHGGGFLDPLAGTVLVTMIGTVIAVPLGVAAAVWVTEYGRPPGLARAVESAIEVIAGTPSIVLALFGLFFFSQGIFGFLSFTSEGGGVFGRSFLIAGAMLSLIALPLVFGATREALNAVPAHVREASYALGKTRAATIRRILLPASRPGIATGTALGMGRIAGDTAIIVILLGLLRFDGAGAGVPVLDTLRGTGSTLTSYTYANSPAGEGGAEAKAWAAAFVLLVLVVALNWLVDWIGRRWKAPAWTR
ncbi:MAG TPA: phosphate ABC transporter permease PstA [Thermoleophilaceae bacterium]|nr:phosphate ABC transporter permease PstA [Thermoleophilaceae bacterium]